MTLQEGMTPKEKRMLKAARKRYRENKDLQTVASELNLAYQTVKNYFAGDEMKRFERHYSESDKQLLDSQLEQMIKDGTETALTIHGDLKAYLKDNPEADPKLYRDLMIEAQKIPERHITMLQEMGIKKKPKERKEIEDKTSGPAEVNVNIEAVEQQEEAENSE